MRITNQNQPPVSSSNNSNTQEPAPTPRNEATTSASSLSDPTSRSYPVSLVPSFELLNLAATLQHVPPVREEVIAETVRRLAAGQLQTNSTAERTARAILGL